MNLLKYSDYISEKVVYNLILESKVIFSNKFINIINSMSSNKIAIELKKLYSQDVDALQHNYIDTTDIKDTVSFTPDRKVKEINNDKDKIVKWEVINDERYLTHNPSNNSIFATLNYEKPSGEPNKPSIGTIGEILAETISPSSGRVYVVFQYDEGDGVIKTVLNKEALEPTEDFSDDIIWKTSRNNIKVGRLARAILTASEITFTDKDIEEFTNQYKATYDVLNDVLKQFDVVKGKDIAYWYDNDETERYKSGNGTLNNSCMAHSPSDYFDIYCENSNVSLVILYDDNGKVENGKYTSNRIKGRALLWNLKAGNDIKSLSEAIFMDRIYTTNDSDVNLFKQFAQKNGWWYKLNQSMNWAESITNGSETKRCLMVCDLENADFDSYPYMDTMCFASTKNKIASNSTNPYTYNNEDDSDEFPMDRAMRDTEGEYGDPEEY